MVCAERMRLCDLKAHEEAVELSMVGPAEEMKLLAYELVIR